MKSYRLILVFLLCIVGNISAYDVMGNNRSATRVLRNQSNGTVTGFEREQATDFYPFGYAIDRGWAFLQPYKFGGKELDDMHGLQMYDQGFRFFGADLPITWSMDPLSEKYYNTSPYAQMGNNPVMNIDPDGRDWYMSERDGSRMWRDDNASRYIDGFNIEWANIGESISFKEDNKIFNFRQNMLLSVMYLTNMKPEHWVPFGGDKKGCKVYTDKMLANVGLTPADGDRQIYLASLGKDGRAGGASSEFYLGLNLIMNMLMSGNPLIAGVDYKEGSPNTDGMTDHFVVLMGMTESIMGLSFPSGMILDSLTATALFNRSRDHAGPVSFNFYDSYTRYEEGRSPQNIFKVSNYQITSNKGQYLPAYRITTVRPNK